MTHLSHIISKYEEKFDGLLYEFADSTTDRDGNVDSIGSSGFNIASKDIKSFLRTFAEELVREAFEVTKVEKKNATLKDSMGRVLPNLRIQGWNGAIDTVKARQQEFIKPTQNK